VGTLGTLGCTTGGGPINVVLNGGWGILAIGTIASGGTLKTLPFSVVTKSKVEPGIHNAVRIIGTFLEGVLIEVVYSLALSL
jgi:hypothetical protein